MSTPAKLLLSLGLAAHLWAQAPDLLGQAESAFRSGDLSQAAWPAEFWLVNPGPRPRA